MTHLDGFRNVVGNLGHATGDTLLREAAARLRRVAPGNAVVARLGGR